MGGGRPNVVLLDAKNQPSACHSVRLQLHQSQLSILRQHCPKRPAHFGQYESTKLLKIIDPEVLHRQPQIF